MGEKEQSSLNNNSDSKDKLLTESKLDKAQKSTSSESSQSKSDKPQQSKIVGISLDEFLANSKEKNVRQVSNYIYVGFRKHCQLKKFEYRALNGEWLSRFKEYINKGGK